ncbi:hypothetical protein GOP47_0025268 [Adiantum capillus-veneris]|uniref:Uncharacterized protein n=1 Tax=Adiantum capillus-veneris TaxID=13818 RepID=A0A9D4U1W0_ADICA|nr:hypothetical protein GOP47_0025268 [Adiantum capillus-veneris]
MDTVYGSKERQTSHGWSANKMRESSSSIIGSHNHMPQEHVVTGIQLCTHLQRSCSTCSHGERLSCRRLYYTDILYLLFRLHRT